MKTQLDNDLKKMYEAFNQKHDQLRESLMASLPSTSKQHKQKSKLAHIGAFIGDTIMKNRITKLAAAAVIIIAVILGLNFIGGPSKSGLVFADVVRPILTARTVVFNVISAEGENVPITRVMNMGTQRVRGEVLSPDGKTVQVIIIVDYDTSRMLQLIPKQMTAVLIDLKDMSEKPENILETMRNIITELQNDPNVSIKPLGEKEINGQIAKGFRAIGPDVELTVWADPQTTLPIRMEQKWRQMHFVCTDFQFDIEMDESLFRMEIPEGYSELPRGELPIDSSTEQDLIESLRIWAEVILDGVFPRELSTEVYVDDVNKNREKFAKLQQEQKVELAMKLGPGFIFFNLLKAENDWHYVGNGVKLGDAESEVCWYRPDGSETYRVIYGDLSVKDVAPENLPK